MDNLIAHEVRSSAHDANSGDNVGIEVEVQSTSGDSGIGSDVESVISGSITSSVFGFQYENGRRYHAYREGAYLLPNDAEEQDRLDLHHHIFRLILGGALHTAPLPDHVERVLDLGTGTGIWAIDFADERPSSMIYGTDLSPIQPGWTPPNLQFYVDDFEQDWTWSLPSDAFDFIHGRGMGGSVANWPLFYSRVLAHLKPGGWFENQEYAAWISSDDDPELKKAPHTRQWQEAVNEAARRFGKEMDVAAVQREGFERAGFVDVEERVFKIPIGGWARDVRLKEIGKYQRAHMIACIESFTLAPLVRILNWRVEEVQVLMAGVRNEFSNPRLHLLTMFHFVHGRKTFDGGTAAS